MLPENLKSSDSQANSICNPGNLYLKNKERIFDSYPNIYWEHLNESSQARNWSFEAGGKRKKERGRRKEPKEVFLQILDAPVQAQFLCGRHQAGELRQSDR